MFNTVFNIILKPYELRLQKRTDKASIYNYKLLAKKRRNIFTKEICEQNDYYYYAYHIKKYCELSNDVIIKAAIEHGASFEKDGVWEADINNKFNSIFTLGEYRKKVLEKHTNKQIFEIGINIAYVNSYLTDEEVNIEKKKNGKTLVVFPSHSTTQVKMNYDIDLFIDEIKRIEYDYDTIIVCLYWKDILLKRNEIYEKEGYKIVCAGHLFDKNFLPRLKTILLMSDRVMSNYWGSYIGQAVFLKKPVYLVSMDCSVETKNEEELSEYENTDLDTWNYLFELFCNPNEEITEKQRELCDYIWGIRKNKTKEELLNIIESL